MSVILQPWQLAFAAVCSWVNDRQQKIIEFQNAQIETLLRQQGRKRILLSDKERRLLAVKAKMIGRKALHEITTIVTPGTMMRWHKRLVAEKWDYSIQRKGKPGRRPIESEVSATGGPLRQRESELGIRPYPRCLGQLGS